MQRIAFCLTGACCAVGAHATSLVRTDAAAKWYGEQIIINSRLQTQAATLSPPSVSSSFLRTPQAHSTSTLLAPHKSCALTSIGCSTAPVVEHPSGEISTPATPKQTAVSSTAAKPIQPPAPPVPTNPFKSGVTAIAAAIPAPVKTTQQATTTQPKTVTTKPVSTAQPPVATEWVALTGQTLRDTIFVWATKATCSSESRHWTVAWETETNYRIDAPLHFTGTFKDALNGVFNLYQGASVPLYAGTNTAQCILKIDDKP